MIGEYGYLLYIHTVVVVMVVIHPAHAALDIPVSRSAKRPFWTPRSLKSYELTTPSLERNMYAGTQRSWHYCFSG